MNEESESKVPVVESDSEPKAIPEAPPITELGPEKPAPPGFTPIPTSAIEQLEATSAEFKSRPVIQRLAEKEPEFRGAVERLGTAIGAVTAEKRTSSAEAPSPAESQDNQAVLVLLALGALGGLILLSRQKTEQQT